MALSPAHSILLIQPHDRSLQLLCPGRTALRALSTPRVSSPASARCKASLFSILLEPLDSSRIRVVALGAAAVGGVASIAMAAMASPYQQRAAVEATTKGMDLFRQGDISGSIKEFDRAMSLDARKIPYLWQRGLSLYYAGRFQEAAKQFRADVAVNPNDTEEAIWCYLSEAMASSPTEARANFLQVGRDSRPVMRTAYDLFKTGSPGPDVLLDLAAQAPESGSEFYALLYAGLFCEAEGDTELAKKYISEAAQTVYSKMSSDYMADVARVHCTVRRWNL